MNFITRCFPALCSMLLMVSAGYAQQPVFVQDSTLNNLVHPKGYQPSGTNRLGAVSKFGNAQPTMIVIPGIGFGQEAYAEFVAAFEESHTVYVVTAAGFGGTPAPPMPAEGIPYADLTWTNGLMHGIIDLIEKEQLIKPVIVAHFVTGTQVALQLALRYPEKIGRIIILSGQPYRYYPVRESNGQYQRSKETILPTERRQKLVEAFWAPKWFKTVTKETWVSNNWQSEEYTKDSTMGRRLVRISAEVPLQVNIRYLLEFFAFDITNRYSEISVPVLFLIPGFDEHFLTGKEEYLKYFQKESWNSARGKNPLFEFSEIPDARIFLWLDNPVATFKSIREFIK